LLKELGSYLLPTLLDQGFVQVVPPRAGRLDEASLDLVHVVIGYVLWVGVDDEVQAREHGLGEPDIELRVLTVEGALQDVLHALPDVRVVPFARHVDQAGEEAPIGVAPYKKPDALAFLEVEDAHRDLEELVLGDLEQLVARVGLEGLHQVFLVVTSLWKARALQNALYLAPHERYLQRARAVRREGVQTEEAPLSRDLALGVELLHADVVQVRRSVDRGAGVRLGQVEEVGSAGKLLRLGRQPGEAVRDAPGARLSQDAEAGLRHGPQNVFPVLRAQVVLTVAQEGEVAVVDPLEKGSGFVELVLVDRRSVLVQL
jgi:hypothetical protein